MAYDIANAMARQNFGVGPNIAEIQQARAQNALLQNRVAQIPQTNALLGAQVQQEQTLAQHGQEQINAQQDQEARSILGQGARAIADAADPMDAATQFGSRRDVQAAAQRLGLDPNRFVPQPGSDPEMIRKGAGMLAQSLGVMPKLMAQPKGAAIVNADTGGVVRPAEEEHITPYQQAELLVRNREADLQERKLNEQVDPASVEQAAQMIAHYQAPMLTGFSLKGPWGQQVVARVGQINPEYQGQRYPVIQKNIQEYGPSGQTGRKIVALNTAISHMQNLGDLSQSLGQGDSQTANKILQGFQTEFGNPNVNNFNLARDIVMEEVGNAILNNGGSATEREQLMSTIKAAQTPQQIQDALQVGRGLLAGKLTQHRTAYKYAMKGSGVNDFEDLLSPETKAALEPIEARGGGVFPQQQSGPPRISSDADYDALASGTQYYSPDGKLRTKR